MIENLTKENFWNELHSKHPDAVEFFIEWFCEYKREVNWDSLFGNRIQNELAGTIQFGDIPFEFQNGIIARFELQFFNNKHGNGKEEYYQIAGQYKGQVRNLFAHVQKQLLKIKAARN